MDNEKFTDGATENAQDAPTSEIEETFESKFNAILDELETYKTKAENLETQLQEAQGKNSNYLERMKQVILQRETSATSSKDVDAEIERQKHTPARHIPENYFDAPLYDFMK